MFISIFCNYLIFLTSALAESEMTTELSVVGDANMTTEPSAFGKANMTTEPDIADEANMTKESFLGVDLMQLKVVARFFSLCTS